MYYALEHDYISDIRMKKRAEEERKDERKEERNGELKTIKPCFMRAQSNDFFFFERFLLQNRRASL